MVDIEEVKKDVDDLKEKYAKLELGITTSLGDIKSDLVEIKAFMQNNNKTNDLKNELIKQKVDKNTEDIKTVKDAQGKIIWTIILGVVALIGRAVIYYIQNTPNP